ncbi:MAG TPA: ABC transporter substrate-binding protein [Kofleriaceae bacterium]
MQRFLLMVVVVVAACSGDDSSIETCQVDADCSAGSVCELRDEQAICVATADAPIVIGQTGAITGTNQMLGQRAKLGVELAFAEQNALGGIRGRMLELQFRDDAYVPEVAEDAVRELVDAKVSPTEAPHCPSTTLPLYGTTSVSETAVSRGPNAVLAMIGSVGAPTAVRAAAIAVETQTLYFGAFVGTDTVLRDDQAGACATNIFNVRASYAQEARATLELFQVKGVPDYRNLISFDQNDTFGQAGYDGLVKAYQEFIGPFPSGADPINPIKRFRYVRNDDTSVPAVAAAMTAHLALLLENQAGTVTVGVMMTDTYGAATALIEYVRRWQYASDAQQTQLQKATRLKLHFSNMSFVNADALGDRLVASGNVTTPNGPMPFTDGVYVSQVVPNFRSDPSAVVAAYNREISGNGEPSFLSLEAYIAARVLIVGLLAHEGPFTSAALATTLEAQSDLSVGLDGMFGFSPANHQYSSSVWGTALQADGTFANLYVWRAGSPIQITP